MDQTSEAAKCTMHLYQHHSCRSSSCPRSSPQGCKSTAELQAGIPPSSFASHLPGQATTTWDCHLQQNSTSVWFAFLPHLKLLEKLIRSGTTSYFIHPGNPG